MRPARHLYTPNRAFTATERSDSPYHVPGRRADGRAITAGLDTGRFFWQSKFAG